MKEESGVRFRLSKNHSEETANIYCAVLFKRKKPTTYRLPLLLPQNKKVITIERKGL